jgi:cell division septation protein DedD
MSESNFREIQLNTKQVVFLFMACVVALLGVFLLGVQVGHGVSDDGTTATAAAGDAASDSPAPTVLPPPTNPKPDDFGYDRELKGKGDGKPASATPPNPSADAPPDTPPAAKPAVTPAPKATPAPPAATPAGAEKPASATAVWYVQIDSFSSRDNAQKQIDTLKTKGHQAIVFTAPGGGARYKTRIGPMERNAADALKNRLSREGFRPTVIK